MNKEALPIFYAVDDDYVPFLAVSIHSLISNSSKNYDYHIKILYTNITDKNIAEIKKYETENVKIEFVDLNYYIKKVEDQLYTRDYYSKNTYFRLFIPELYPQYTKAVYLDADTVVLGDIADLYNIDIGDNLLGAIPDESVQNIHEFQEYVEKVVGHASYKNYFNAGILVMNLDELRKFNFQEKFMYLLGTVKFVVAQDQDYLNRLCKGRVRIISNVWDKMPMENPNIKTEDIKLIHYNLSFKPWYFDNILYDEFFWKYAKETKYYKQIMDMKANFSDEDKYKIMSVTKRVMALCEKESSCVGDDRMYKAVSNDTIEKSRDRLVVLDKIEKFEREGKFDVDTEDDPPTLPLLPEDIDYLRVKYKNKIKRSVANKIGEKFVDELIKTNKLIIKDIEGIENLNCLNSTGAILTCNHFNPFDCFTVEKTFRESNLKHKRLYKVIREGNYTNFPGLYGFFFKNCDTLPLSSVNETMKKFISSVDTILKKGDYILIYPEQSLWWNYKKPKPLKDGAFNLAVRNKVPVVPLFITLKESDIIGEDGFPIMEYYVHIEKPIFPDETISNRENIKIMKKKNFQVWKNIYEDFYQIPLEYTTINKDVFDE